jgi:hypothetical protein
VPETQCAIGRGTSQNVTNSRTGKLAFAEILLSSHHIALRKRSDRTSYKQDLSNHSKVDWVSCCME